MCTDKVKDWYSQNSEDRFLDMSNYDIYNIHIAILFVIAKDKLKKSGNNPHSQKQNKK